MGKSTNGGNVGNGQDRHACLLFFNWLFRLCLATFKTAVNVRTGNPLRIALTVFDGLGKFSSRLIPPKRLRVGEALLLDEGKNSNARC